MTDKKETMTIRPGVDLPNLMTLTAKEVKAPAVAIGFLMAFNSLKKIAERADELGDPLILLELEHLGIINISEEKKAELEKGLEVDK